MQKTWENITGLPNVSNPFRKSFFFKMMDSKRTAKGNGVFGANAWKRSRPRLVFDAIELQYRNSVGDGPQAT